MVQPGKRNRKKKPKKWYIHTKIEAETRGQGREKPWWWWRSEQRWTVRVWWFEGREARGGDGGQREEQKVMWSERREARGGNGGLREGKPTVVMAVWRLSAVRCWAATMEGGNCWGRREWLREKGSGLFFILSWGKKISLPFLCDSNWVHQNKGKDLGKKKIAHTPWVKNRTRVKGNKFSLLPLCYAFSLKTFSAANSKNDKNVNSSFSNFQVF